MIESNNPTLFDVCVIFCNEDNSRDDDAVVGGIRIRVLMVVAVLVLVMVIVARGTATDIRGEEDGGEEDKEAQSDGYSVA